MHPGVLTCFNHDHAERQQKQTDFQKLPSEIETYVAEIETYVEYILSAEET